MQKTFWKWVVILVIWWVFVIAASYISENSFIWPWAIGATTASIIWRISANILSVMVSWFFYIVLSWFALDILRAVKFTWAKQHFSRVNKIIPWVITSLLYNIIRYAWILLLFIVFYFQWISLTRWWTLWLFFPVWLFLAVWLMVFWIIAAIRFKFWDLFVIDKWYNPVHALKASWKITKDNWRELYVLSGYQTLINIPWALALLVGLFATIPTAFLADVDWYLSLLKEIEKSIPEEA